jgi:hypothetical protein
MRILAVLLFVVTSAYAQEPRQATLAQQKMCADQAKKFYNEPDFKSKEFTEYTSHYDPKMNVCYVMIRIDLKKDDAEQQTVAYMIYDAFEGTGRGHLQMKLIGPDNKPYVCSVKPVGSHEDIYCKTEDQFWELVKKHFGLEQP